MASKLARCRARADDCQTLSDKELQKKIRQIDEGRAKHQKLFSDLKWGSKDNYHLCVNTTGIQIRDMIPSIKGICSGLVCPAEVTATERNPIL